MASLDGLKVRKLLERGVVVQEGADTPIQIRMRYIGAGSVTSVTVTTGTSIVTVTVEPTGTVTKTYAFATFTTVGALADQINSDGLFEVKVLDALRSDATTGGNYQINGAIVAGTDANGVAVYDVLTDTSVYKAVTACLTNARNFDRSKISESHRVHLQAIQYWATLGGAGTNLVRIYLRRKGVETQIFGEISVSATSTTINFAGGLGDITGNDGDEIIARLQDGTSLADAGLSFRITGILE